LFRRRRGATIRHTINTNPKLFPDDDLSLATRREIHLLPPAEDNGTARAEIILTNAAVVDTWKLSATQVPAQTDIPGIWKMAAYAEFNGGIIVKISRTIEFRIDSKFSTP
jgi:hypothetical protein